jgi:hypothetical protein
MSYLFERYPGARKLSAAFNTIIVEFPSNTNMTDIGKRAYFQAVKSFTEILILADPSANFTTMLNIQFSYRKYRKMIWQMGMTFFLILSRSLWKS